MQPINNKLINGTWMYTVPDESCRFIHFVETTANNLTFN